MYRWGEEDIQAALEVLQSGNLFRYTETSRTEIFETEFAKSLSAEHALAVHSGTSALIVALAACGVGPGDEVIIPAYTFVATAAAVVWVGAVPVLCEVDDSLTLAPYDVAARVNSRTKAIIAVHMLGAPADLESLQEIAETHEVALIEDCAQACGASYNGKKIGTIGTVGCFSFNQAKTLSCGEGGAVVTNEERIFMRLRMAHDPGSLWRKQTSGYGSDDFPGLGVRMDEIRAAIMRVQLSRLPEILTNLRRSKITLKSRLSGIKGLQFRTVHDPDGDSATTMTLFLPTVKLAKHFVDSLERRGIYAGAEGAAALGRIDQEPHTMYDPVRPDRHIYRFWTYIMNQGLARRPGCSYECPRYSGISSFDPDMCPTTLGLLSRGVLLGINPDWDQEAIDKVASAIQEAASEVLK